MNAFVHLNIPKIYSYNGWTFQWHSYCGPWPLKKNGDPRERAGDVFWNVIDEFQKLSKDERESFRVGGGSRLEYV